MPLTRTNQEQVVARLYFHELLRAKGHADRALRCDGVLEVEILRQQRADTLVGEPVFGHRRPAGLRIIFMLEGSEAIDKEFGCGGAQASSSTASHQPGAMCL